MIQEITDRQKKVVDINPGVINIRGLYKSFGAHNHILKGVDLTVEKGENLVVLGKSGSGKSVAIKCMVGLIKADKGAINIFDTDITTLGKKELNLLRVRIGFLFQSSALYDSMTVRENLKFPLRRHFKKMSSSEVQQTIVETLESVGLAEAIDKMPSELSGG